MKKLKNEMRWKMNKQYEMEYACLLNINDLTLVSKLLWFIMFADDTNIFISGHDLDNLISTLNSELEVVNDWFSANLLSLNIKNQLHNIWEQKN